MLDHSHSPKTPAGAEAAVERTRADLATSLAALRDKLSVDGLMSDGAALVQRHAGSTLHTMDQAIRHNPLAVALTVAGIAWLVFGKRGTPEASSDMTGEMLAGTRFEAVTRWEDEGGPTHPEHDTPVAEHADAWIGEAAALRRTAMEAMATLESAAGRALAPAADLARDRAAVTAGYVADLAKSFRSGLSNLSTEAQDRIAAAREAAFTARHSVAKAAERTLDEHPMSVGFIAAAVAAALAVALPTTETERSALAGAGDRLLDEARRMLADERERAGEVAADLANGLKDDLRMAQARVADAIDTLAHPDA